MILVGGPSKRATWAKGRLMRRTEQELKAQEGGRLMDEVFDYGTGVPYTHEDLEVLFRGKVTRRIDGSACSLLRLVRCGLR